MGTVAGRFGSEVRAKHCCRSTASKLKCNFLCRFPTACTQRLDLTFLHLAISAVSARAQHVLGKGKGKGIVKVHIKAEEDVILVTRSLFYILSIFLSLFLNEEKSTSRKSETAI